MSLASLLNTSIDFQRKSVTKDASGGQAAGGNWVAVNDLTSLPALIQPTRGKARNTLGQRQVFITHNIYLAQEYDVRRGDRVYHPATGNYFTVHGFENMGGQNVAWRVECVQET